MNKPRCTEERQLQDKFTIACLNRFEAQRLRDSAMLTLDRELTAAIERERHAFTALDALMFQLDKESGS